MNKYKGIMLVISGPSGSGKGCICTHLTKSRDDIYISISVTSRIPRPDDVEGINYFFKTKEEFEKMIENNELIEWVNYCDNYYGTPKRNVEEKLDDGINVVFEIEVNGALNIKKRYPDCVLIFVVPPGYGDLVKRLRGRGTEEEEIIQKRIKKAADEVSLIEDYDYIVVNDTIENASYQVQAIIDAERNKVSRNQEKIEKFINTLKEAGEYD